MNQAASRSVRRTAIILAAVVVYGLINLPAHGQTLPGIRLSRPTAPPTAVEYLYPEQVTVAAGKTSEITLHFHVTQGLHINSHTPKDEDLIPTTFSIPDGFGVRLDGTNYPRGSEYALPLDSGTKLNVYAGEFIIKARIVATAGNHLVEGKLRYQACDQRQCMPPRTITVPIDVIGK